MSDACYVLLDNRAGIQFGRHVMARGTNNLHATLPRLMIGLGTHEGRQERMVDVDNMMRIGGYHLIADNLHVASQHNEGDAFFL